MPEQLPAFLSAVVADGFTLQQLAGGSVAGFAFGGLVSRVLQRRVERARAIFLEELKRGEKTLPLDQIDEGVAIAYRYFRAAQEGAARLNLRLMAKVIAGQARQSALYADEFLRHADVIAGLRREEVILLGALQRHWNAPETRAIADDDRMGAVHHLLETELIPEPFADASELAAMQSAVLRTGFLSGVPTFGGAIYRPTRAFQRLCCLVSLEAALRAEPA